MPFPQGPAIWRGGVLLLAALVLISGCTQQAGERGGGLPSPAPSLQPGPEPVLSMELPIPSNATSTPVNASTVFSRTFGMVAGGKSLVVDPEEYGWPLFSPDETYTLSIDSTRPVNLLVLESIYAERLFQSLPDYGIVPSGAPDRTISFSYGFTYDVPLVAQEENLIKKTVTFSVPRTGKYLVVLDPRFHGKATWDQYGTSVSHEYFRTTLDLKRLEGARTVSLSSDAGPGAVNEIVGLSTGYFGTVKVYALDEHGYPSLSPGDSLHLSVSTPRPVNILVLDEEGMESFYRTDPVSANIQNRTVEAVHRGYKYGDISPGNGEIFHEDLSLETEAFVRIPEVSKYYVVIDPRFSYEFTSIGGYPSSYTEDFIS
ncbi:MAG: hypothetical protein LUQ25_07160, partial [Methanoregulaceae archaeon]|nr:hypothetical protein [Methanoregulaceae archaeon]